jgi:DNA-binding transcriptional ArsR family regulator
VRRITIQIGFILSDCSIKNSFYYISDSSSVEKKDLSEEIKELNKRINELEKMLSTLIAPLQDVSKITQNYMRLIGVLIDRGGLSPDVMIPELKDPISKDIVRVLLEKTDQNISQIEELVRSKRGTASRRIIREKLKYLEEKKIIKKQLKGSLYVYSLNETIVKKWSQLLGFHI